MNLQLSCFTLWAALLLSNFEVVAQTAKSQQRSTPITPSSNNETSTTNNETGNIRAKQHRRLQECATMPEHGYQYFRSSHSGLRLDVDGSSTANEANVIQSDGTGSSTAWMLDPVGDGYYRIINKKSGLPLVVEDKSREVNANIIQQQRWKAFDGSHWCFIPRFVNGKTVYSVENKRSGMAIRVHWNELGAGVNIYQDVTLNRSVQRFEVIGACADFPLNTIYHITNVNSGLNMVIKNNVLQIGTNILQGVKKNEDDMNDEWYLVPSSNTIGFQRIFAHKIDAVANAVGPSVRLKEAGIDGNDEWCFFSLGEDADDDDTYEIFFRPDMTRVMEVQTSNTAQFVGNIIRLKYTPGADYQRWVVKEADNTPKPMPITNKNSAWSDPIETDIVGAGAFNLPNGNVILYAAENVDDFRNPDVIESTTATTIWNPVTNDVEFYTVQTSHDMFCPGTATLTDRVIITGGKNSGRTTEYNYNTGEWSTGAGMKVSRGYHAMTVLGNGDIFTIGGSWSGGIDGKIGEIWSAIDDEWSLLTGVDDGPMNTADTGKVYRSDNHFWLFTAPNGQIFHAGPAKQMHWINPRTQSNGVTVGSIRESLLRGNDVDAMNGNAVMFDIGKIFTVGGALDYNNSPATANAFSIDINGDEAEVTILPKMSSPRSFANSVVLPDGDIVVIGGMTKALIFTDLRAVMKAEMWSHSAEQWVELGEMATPRTYHSVAMILKDGRVMAAGGGLCGGCGVNHFDIEVLTPPYLFNIDGSLASRPEIQFAPTSTKAGRTFVVTMDTSQQHTFALVRLGAVTHTINNDMRRFPLPVTIQDGNRFTVAVPSNVNVALVGRYYLYAMNSNGAPSVATDIIISL